MITIEKNSIDVQDYLAIRNSVGWIALKEDQAQTALEHSLYVVGAYENDRLVGMGRLVGDGAVICYVQDLIVSPEYQQKGVGSMILTHLVDYVKELRMDNTQMMLLSLIHI